MLTLDELVAGVLMDYATYRNPRDGSEWTAEEALDELLIQSKPIDQPPNPITRIKRKALAAWARWRGNF